MNSDKIIWNDIKKDWVPRVDVDKFNKKFEEFGITAEKFAEARGLILFLQNETNKGNLILIREKNTKHTKRLLI